MEAKDGVEALETIGKVHPDLIITDVLMFTMDGYEFVKELHANPATATIPVIFYVAACYEQEARFAETECGVSHILTKPAEPEVIVATVNAALLNKSLEISSGQLARFACHHLDSPSDPIDPKETVFVVDDDPAMGRLLSEIMNSTHLKVASFSSPEEFLAEYRDDPGCLLLDLQMPSMPGIALLASLRARRMQIPVIILTAQNDVTSARLALRLRALDFLDKTVDQRTLLARVYYALQEDSIRRRKEAEVNTIRGRMAALTEREKQLVELLISGSSSKEIAAKLQISVRTVGNHRTHLMAKTGAANVADLVRMSMIAIEV
jgi:two-component system response regulator FixJ